MQEGIKIELRLSGIKGELCLRNLFHVIVNDTMLPRCGLKLQILYQVWHSCTKVPSKVCMTSIHMLKQHRRAVDHIVTVNHLVAFLAYSRLVSEFAFTYHDSDTTVVRRILALGDSQSKRSFCRYTLWSAEYRMSLMWNFDISPSADERPNGDNSEVSDVKGGEIENYNVFTLK
ncbi:hypothetical protein RIF29_18874 [Crotalaria pallida]|uniref:Uncharacterized protein n=1 Tax=Crotalaria pallida TaxID=3830 RepID=A0AAN9EYY7_CROPI